MADLIIEGGRKISGVVQPSGNKNAALPMLCATLLTDDEVELTNVPDINDISKILEYFLSNGSLIDYRKDAQRLYIRHDFDRWVRSDSRLPVGIRSSVLLLAPLVRRLDMLAFDTDASGCALGIREIDPHIDIIRRFGGELESTRPYRFRMAGRPVARSIWAEYASVTATETFAMMAAVADGTSVLTNAASEPHVQALCRMLKDMGATVEGIGTSRLTVTGVPELKGTAQRVPDDHHEVATFLAIGAVTGGRVTVRTDVLHDMTLILEQFGKLGLQFETGAEQITVTGWTRRVTKPLTSEMTAKIEAAPWPYFPADLLPQAVGVAVGCDGDVMFWNKIYEGALSWSSELSKFGVRTHLSDPHRLIVFGGNKLRPAVVEAPYIIRVVLGLVLAAIQAEGVSIIRNADPVRRAHPNFVENLNRLGARAQWA